MKKISILLAAICLTLTACGATKDNSGSHIIGFYNVENLFDTLDDEGKDDAQFLPDGSYAWTQEKYEVKLGNIARVINEMAEKNGRYHAVLGLAEVENAHVLKDLVSRKELSKAKYKFVHYESPDVRGIDVAFLYRPSEFKLLESKAIPYDFNSSIRFEKTKQEQAEFTTRDVLMIRGTIDGEMFAFFVGHLPSRIGDKGADMRARGAEIIYNAAMDLQKKYPGIKIAVMGDMNDNPEDESMTRYLHGRETLSSVGSNDFFDPFLRMHKDGFGTEEYHGEWNIFDIIMVNSALADQNSAGLKIQKSDDTHYGYVFNPPFLVQQEGQYKGTPFRTFSGGRFIKGYSDHYPTYIKISK